MFQLTLFVRPGDVEGVVDNLGCGAGVRSHLWDGVGLGGGNVGQRDEVLLNKISLS